MTAVETIIEVFGTETLTNREICNRTGMTMKNVSAYIVTLRKRGQVVRIGTERPVLHRVIHSSASLQAQCIVRQALSQPMSVFHLANPADRLGFEPFTYTERN